MGSINPLVAVAQQVLLGGAVKQNHALEHAVHVAHGRSQYVDSRGLDELPRFRRDRKAAR